MKIKPSRVEKLAFYGNGVALTLARTDTRWFQSFVFDQADAVLFLAGRIHFNNLAGERYKANAGAPACLIAYGRGNVAALFASGLKGKMFVLK